MQLRTLDGLDLREARLLAPEHANVRVEQPVQDDPHPRRARCRRSGTFVEHTNKVAIASRLGRHDGEVDLAYSLEPVGARMAELLERECVFVNGLRAGKSTTTILNQIDANQFVLLENLRFNKGETKNDEYCRQLAQGIELYVTDAFRHSPIGPTLDRRPARAPGSAQACGGPTDREGDRGARQPHVGPEGPLHGHHGGLHPRSPTRSAS